MCRKRELNISFNHFGFKSGVGTREALCRDVFLYFIGHHKVISNVNSRTLRKRQTWMEKHHTCRKLILFVCFFHCYLIYNLIRTICNEGVPVCTVLVTVYYVRASKRHGVNIKTSKSKFMRVSMVIKTDNQQRWLHETWTGQKK